MKHPSSEARAYRRIPIGLVMYLGEDGGRQNVPIWEHGPRGGPG